LQTDGTPDARAPRLTEPGPGPYVTPPGRPPAPSDPADCAGEAPADGAADAAADAADEDGAGEALLGPPCEEVGDVPDPCSPCGEVVPVLLATEVGEPPTTVMVAASTAAPDGG
jgi:hypothetical protein